eukprot:4288214-Prymnesium_polylepis.1
MREREARLSPIRARMPGVGSSVRIVLFLFLFFFKSIKTDENLDNNWGRRAFHKTSQLTSDLHDLSRVGWARQWYEYPRTKKESLKYYNYNFSSPS